MPNPEKMRVLDLLEAGKINADEAATLLAALNTGPRFITKQTRDNMEEKFKQFALDCNRFARSIGAKSKELYKDVQPKIKCASKAALHKAACALDKAAGNINDGQSITDTFHNDQNDQNDEE